MQKVALVFVVAVIVPSLVLAGLALRSVRSQQWALERQEILLAEGAAESVAHGVEAEVQAALREFSTVTAKLLGPADPRELRHVFDERLRQAWPLATVGFAVGFTGDCYSPSMAGQPAARQFRIENELFLCNREPVEVVWNSPKGRINLSQLDQEAAGKASGVFATKDGQDTNTPAAAAAALSFRDIMGDSHEGTVARFVQDRLTLLFWFRSERDPYLVFGAQVDLPRLQERLKPQVRIDPSLAPEFALQLRDDRGGVVVRIPEASETPGRRPLAVAEVGTVLPHWQVAAFALNPDRLSQAAATSRLLLGLLVAVLLLAIGVGSWLITADLRRQLTLARQKTDFVSNVSHELKTPLTSIRMFAELLAEDRVTEPEKRRQFLGIIGTESARLTRLINQVLDFARMERGGQSRQFAPTDLREVATEAVEACRPQLESAGLRLEANLPAEPVSVSADRDALVQLVTNLLSNVGKYAAAGREAVVILQKVHTRRGWEAELEVLDRGPGVPPAFATRIFEQFFRAGDALASGVSGSGLGLTLARQIARAHGGDVGYRPREGGGSCFTLRLPLRSEGTRS